MYHELSAHGTLWPRSVVSLLGIQKVQALMTVKENASLIAVLRRGYIALDM